LKAKKGIKEVIGVKQDRSISGQKSMKEHIISVNNDEKFNT